MRTLKSLILSLSALFVLSTLLTSVIIVGPYFVNAQSSNTNTTYTSQKIGVKITSPKANQTLPIGQLTIYGTSSDTPKTNCQVYVDWNNTKPMQNVTGVGPAGPNDYSNWTFTYAQNYHLIMEGTNDLTSKISCYGNSGISNVTTKYYSINVTGSTNPTSLNIPTTSDNPSTDNTTTGFRSTGYHLILPQYSEAGANNSQYVDDNIPNEGPQSMTYAAINNDFSYDDSEDSSTSKSDDTNHGDDSNSDTGTDSGSGNNNKASDNRNDNEKIKSHTIKYFMSLKFEKIKNGPNNLKFKWPSGNLNSEDVSKYIHNLIKEKLDRVSERLLD